MVRVRFAPSPTGFLHIGGARAYIFNWLYAGQKGGAMVLRIDDMDLERNAAASRQSIFYGLAFAVFTAIGHVRAIQRLRNHPC